MRLIDADKFLQDMADLYRHAGWDEREVHFSLADLRSNIGMENVVLILQREADTVQVIRCKDCARNENCFMYREAGDDNGYCAWAVKRDK